jgi:hypothetical protein
MVAVTSNPYELWSLRKSIGVMRNVIPAFSYWLPMFTSEVNSVDEYIDFEKLPALNRRLAPFVRPMGQGKPIYTDQSTAYRFKPAYIKLRDAIDPTRILTKIPGIDAMLDPATLGPMARREALRAAITVQHIRTIQRRWEWMAAQAVMYGKITVGGTPEYPPVQLDFLRDAGQTITLGSGDGWGDSGVSVMDFIQTVCDLMIYPVGGFGGFPIRLTMGSAAWQAFRADAGVKDAMNKFYPVTGDIAGGAVGNRGIIASEKVVKVGELFVGGAGGAVLELYVYRDSYVADDGTEVSIMNPNDVVFTSSPEAMHGFQCFGAIVDPFAEYQAISIFPRNWMEVGDPAVEYILHQSAPLMVPVNPNATLLATVVGM